MASNPMSNGDRENCSLENSFVSISIEDVESLMPLLQRRLPFSSNIYNIAQNYSKFRSETNFYILKVYDLPDVDDTWIIAMYQREDYGHDIIISTNSNPKVTPEIKIAFVNTKILDWTKQYTFIVFDQALTLMLSEISLKKGNCVLLTPCYFYYFPKHNSLSSLKTFEESPYLGNMELQSLNSSDGVDFLTGSWKYSNDQTRKYVEKIVARNLSVGCFINGKPVSGIALSGNGLMGMLYTDKEHRNKNFGKTCMQRLIGNLDKAGYYPCSVVEVKNLPSISFHEKVGMKRLHTIDFLIHQISEF